ncbi:nitric oxide reductase activation protein NorD [Aquabacterium sp.]|uniref:nitric oxide reductase activation protein NorD n=1 Tax=Aquabacterium sp. TaxID=1872578 RepID=UPI0037852A13
MEERVGLWWHQLVTRAADRSHAEAAVDLAQVQRAIGLLYRAAGGLPGLRIGSASEAAIGGPRSWLQRIAGSGRRAAGAELDERVLALPPRLAVFDRVELNRDLYLWLAALAACYRPQQGWLADNRAATERALAHWPGLRQRHAALLQAQLAARPGLPSLRGAARAAEQAVQAALNGRPAGPDGDAPGPRDVAPVWLWLQATAGAEAAAAARAEATGERRAATGPAGQGADTRRRRAETVAAMREGAPFMLFFRAESLLSWSELVRVNRAEDDSDDGAAQDAADDMDRLAVAPDGQRCASRVRFDLDLPSAAADDLPLGDGQRLPEWDCRAQRLLPEHCAVQTFVARDSSPFVPDAALRRTARAVRRRFELLRAAPHWRRGETDGEALDLDAWVRHRTAAGADGRSAAPAVFARRETGERSLATLLLADLSQSTDAHVDDQRRVIDVIRDALHVFGEALSATGDAFEMLGFSSVRRQHVRIQHLKGFDERWAAPARQRVGAVKPGFYTRMGAAIRHATGRLAERPERQRLLLLLTDGKPNDLDVYEGRYGLEDTRHAVAEARAAGIQPFCVTIDDRAQDYLPHLFGPRGYVRVQRPQQLPEKLARVYATLAR